MQGVGLRRELVGGNDGVRERKRQEGERVEMEDSSESAVNL